LEIFNYEGHTVLTTLGSIYESYYRSYGTTSAVIDMHASSENFISETKATTNHFPDKNPVTGPTSWLTEQDRLVRAPSVHTITHAGQIHRGIEILSRVTLWWKDPGYYESYVEANFWVARHLLCNIVMGRENSQEGILHPGEGKDFRPDKYLSPALLALDCNFADLDVIQRRIVTGSIFIPIDDIK
jgi:hypothetical protein